MGFVDNYQIPVCTQQIWGYIVLFCEVNGGNALREALPDIPRQLILGEPRPDNFKYLVKLRSHLILPLDSQRSRTKNQNSLNNTTHLQFLDEQSCHDCLAGTRIVCQQKPKTRLW